MTEDELLAELRKFSNNILALGEPISDNRIVDFENKFNLELPADYKYTIQKVNGFTLMGNEVYGIYPENNKESLESVYLFEHNEVSYPQFNYLVPFSPDGGGNFYCFDTRYRTKGGKSCPVVFWVSNYQYTEDDLPEVVYECFIDCVKEIFIEWTLESYDHDGNPLEE